MHSGFNEAAAVRLRKGSPSRVARWHLLPSLQRGRSCEAAEGYGQPSALVPPVGGFNEAAAVRLRKAQDRPMDASASSCFNEAAAVRLRKAVESGDPVAIYAGFNEAAAVRLRKGNHYRK